MPLQTQRASKGPPKVSKGPPEVTLKRLLSRKIKKNIFLSAWQMSPLFSLQRLCLKNGPSLPLGKQLCGLLQSKVLFSVSGLCFSVLHVRNALNAQVFHCLLVPWQCYQPQQRKVSCHFFILCQRHVCHQSLFFIQLSHLPDLAKSHNFRGL